MNGRVGYSPSSYSSRLRSASLLVAGYTFVYGSYSKPTRTAAVYRGRRRSVEAEWRIQQIGSDARAQMWEEATRHREDRWRVIPKQGRRITEAITTVVVVCLGVRLAAWLVAPVGPLLLISGVVAVLIVGLLETVGEVCRATGKSSSQGPKTRC